MMVASIGLWSHAIAAILYGALSLWQLRRWNIDVRHRPLVTAFAMMAVWAVCQAFAGSDHITAHLAESARNLFFLIFMYGIIHEAADDRRQRAVELVYGAVASVIAVQAVLAFLADDGSVGSARNSVGAVVAAGSLVLVHNLYAQAARGSRWSIRLPMIALAAMWAYDLHLYTVAYLTQNAFDDLFALRGAIAVMLVPLFAVATRRTAEWRIRLSRAAAFQSLSLVAILGYFILMVSATRALETLDGGWVRIAQVGIILAMTATALLLLPSARMRAWLRVVMAKHLFEHRYDYREDWLRFTRAIGRASGDGSPIHERVVKALADMAGCPGGALLAVDDDRRLTMAAHWNWSRARDLSFQASADFIDFLEASSFVIDFGALDNGRIRLKGHDVLLPAGLDREGAAWAGVPLIHGDRLMGIVLLDHPTPRRPMDWEDYDLFRTAGIQAASYLAEARSQEALGHAQRFDEFNRRFAFIMHDIKNLVSQLSLVTRNAERHAENPEFRADMIATLQSSVKKMNVLLARLSGGSAGEAQALRRIALRPILANIAQAKRHTHPVLVSPGIAAGVVADAERLGQAIAHIVQNAIDATPDGSPVRIACTEQGNEVLIEIVDSGIGMSAEFIRAALFQPFASTKEAGFGVGAFEARTLIASMGGRIEVESRESEGSRFTIILPAASADSAAQLERKHA